MKRTMLILLVALVLPVFAAAQTATTGQVAGTVTDPTGALVPGARIILKGQAGQPRETSSDDAGGYRFNLVPPGVYEMEASASGFAAQSVRKVVVNITESAQVNFELKVAGAGEVVTVTAEVPLLRTDSATTGRVVQETTIRQLPLPTRNFQQLLTLSTGTSGSISNSSELGRGDAVINVNGQRTTSNSVLINGVDSNSIGTGSTPNLAVPATDTLQEFVVQTSLYDASQGRSVGGVVAAVTKSGTDSIHGNAYYFLRRTGLNANNFFLNRQGVERPVFDNDQFGGTIGGPIKKERAWFFGSYQGTRQDNGASLLNSLSTVFVPQNLGTDRSPAGLATLAAQWGLLGISPTATTLLTATLPNGDLVIPGVSSPVACAFPALCPTVPVTQSALSTFREDQFNASVDVQVTGNNRLQGKFFLAENPTTQGLFSFAGLQNALPLPGFGADLTINQRLLSVGDTHIFNSNLLNDARFGYSYIRVASVPAEPFTSAALGITSPLSSLFPGAPTMSVSNMFDIGSSPFADNDSNVVTWQFSDTLTWTRGRHTFKFGGEHKRNEVNLVFNAYTRGNVFHLGLLQGNPFRAFLAGVSDLSIMGSGVNQRNIRSSDLSWFIADDWRISPRFTVNLGVRHDYYGPFSDTEGRIVAFDESLVTTVNLGGAIGNVITGGFVQAGNATNQLPGIPQVQDSLVDGDWNNFAPRVGFSWQPFSDQRNIVVRGGYGIYYDRSNARAINNQVLSFPYNMLASVFFTPITSPFVGVPAPSAFPLDVTNPAVFPLGGPPAILPRTPFFIFGATTLVPANGIYPNRNNFRTPYVQQYNLGVQWEFGRNWLLDLGYVGSSGRKLTRLRHANQGASAASTTGPLSSGLSGLAVQGFGVHLMETSANSNYNSMQVSVNKRFSSGLQFLTSYTWSHTFDEYSGAENGVSDVSVVPGNQVNFNNYASSDFDRRHRFITSFVYDLPKFYKGESAAKWLLNDWEVAGIVTMQSGTPFSVLTNANVFTQARANFAAGMGPSDAVLEGAVTDRLGEYFETSAFVAATGVGNFGTTPRNLLRGPNQRNVDFSVVKFFPVSEGKKFEFRTELFNVFNWTNFANPVNIRASANFGQIVRTSTGPRVIQFAFKFNF